MTSDLQCRHESGQTIGTKMLWQHRAPPVQPDWAGGSQDYRGAGADSDGEAAGSEGSDYRFGEAGWEQCGGGESWREDSGAGAVGVSGAELAVRAPSTFCCLGAGE